MSDGIVERLDLADRRALEEAQRGKGAWGDTMSQEEKEARAEMLVEGVIYSLPIEKATELGWTMTPPLPGAENGKRVLVDLSFGQTHRFVRMAELGDNFTDIPIDG